jgi:hypothetical protein
VCIIADTNCNARREPSTSVALALLEPVHGIAETLGVCASVAILSDMWGEPEDALSSAPASPVMDGCHVDTVRDTTLLSKGPEKRSSLPPAMSFNFFVLTFPNPGPCFLSGSPSTSPDPGSTLLLEYISASAASSLLLVVDGISSQSMKESGKGPSTRGDMSTGELGTYLGDGGIFPDSRDISRSSCRVHQAGEGRTARHPSSTDLPSLPHGSRGSPVKGTGLAVAQVSRLLSKNLQGISSATHVNLIGKLAQTVEHFTDVI